MLALREDLKLKLKERWAPPEVFENVLSVDDIEYLLNEELTNDNKRLLPKRVFGLNTTQSQRYLHSKLQSILKFPFKITGGNFFRTSVPYMLHADTGIEENCALYRIFVFPL